MYHFFIHFAGIKDIKIDLPKRKRVQIGEKNICIAI
jgi:hypothetical protein